MPGPALPTIDLSRAAEDADGGALPQVDGEACNAAEPELAGFMIEVLTGAMTSICPSFPLSKLRALAPKSGPATR